MKRYQKERIVFSVLYKAGWVLANLAFGFLVWLILVFIVLQLPYVRKDRDYMVWSAIWYAAPLGIPLGVFLLHAIFYKITKYDLRVFIGTFFLSSWLLGMVIGLSYATKSYARELFFVALSVPLLVLVSSIAFCIYEAVKINRPTRFKSRYAWKSERQLG